MISSHPAIEEYMHHSTSEKELNFRYQFSKLCSEIRQGPQISPEEATTNSKIQKLTQLLVNQVTYPEELIALTYNYTVNFSNIINDELSQKAQRDRFLSGSEIKKSAFLQQTMQEAYLQTTNGIQPSIDFPQIQFGDIGTQYGTYNYDENITTISSRKMSFEDVMATMNHETGHWLVFTNCADSHVSHPPQEPLPAWMKWNHNKNSFHYGFCPEEGLVRSAGALCAELISPNTREAKAAAAVELHDNYKTMQATAQFHQYLAKDNTLQTKSRLINQQRQNGFLNAGVR